MAASTSGQPPCEVAPPPLTASFASKLQPQSKTAHMINTPLILNPIKIIHGTPTLKFSFDEIEEFKKEEGLHQALVMKLSYGQPEMQDLRKLLPKHLGVQGHCLIGWLARRHILIRFDNRDDYVLAASRIVSFLQCNGEEYQYRVFPYARGFNLNEETSRAFCWISLPNLLPEPFAKRSLLSIASAVGRPISIDKEDLVALSGSHTLGFAQCFTFRDRIYNETNNIDSTFASQHQANCPRSGGDSNLASLDPTPALFDSKYFNNLVSKKGLLHSDQALFSGGSTDDLVKTYSTNLWKFSEDFAESMIKMGNIKPLTGNQGQIRVNCRNVN